MKKRNLALISIALILAVGLSSFYVLNKSSWEPQKPKEYYNGLSGTEEYYRSLNESNPNVITMYYNGTHPLVTIQNITSHSIAVRIDKVQYFSVGWYRIFISPVDGMVDILNPYSNVGSTFELAYMSSATEKDGATKKEFICGSIEDLLPNTLYEIRVVFDDDYSYTDTQQAKTLSSNHNSINTPSPTDPYDIKVMYTKPQVERQEIIRNLTDDKGNAYQDFRYVNVVKVEVVCYDSRLANDLYLSKFDLTLDGASLAGAVNICGITGNDNQNGAVHIYDYQNGVVNITGINYDYQRVTVLPYYKPITTENFYDSGPYRAVLYFDFPSGNAPRIDSSGYVIEDVQLGYKEPLNALWIEK